MTGIKRSSPLLIDNTGLTISIAEANAQLAAQLGKTVSQLTAEERQLAVLNATLAAGNGAIAAFGNQQETAADKLARLNATISNTLDTLAIAVQPAFELILDGVNSILSVIQGVSTSLSPLFTVLEVAGIGFGVLLEGVAALLSPIVALGNVISKFLNVALRPMLDFAHLIGDALINAFRSVTQAVNNLTTNNFGFDFDKMAYDFSFGIGRVFGAMAGAIVVAGGFILEKVSELAQGIADFLIGQSPPPTGPLSEIDAGGANTMLAWLDGFAGVSLQPVEQVAANVATALGDIGKLTATQVEAQFKRLDAALQPFKDQLEIVKSRFDAIAEPAKAALTAIDRQLSRALQGLNVGAAGSAEAVRALDAQRAAIESALDVQQTALDNAQIQLALASAQQTEERALLGIREQQLKALDKVAVAVKDVGAATKDATKAVTGGAGAPALEAVATGGGVTGAATAAQPNALAEGFATGFADVAGSGETKKAPKGSGILGGLAKLDIGKALGEKFTQGFNAVTNVINLFIKSQFDPANPDGLVGKLAALPQRVDEFLASVSTAFGINLDGIRGVINTFLTGAFDPTVEGSITYALAQLPLQLPTLLAELPAQLQATLIAPFTTAISEIGTSVATFFTGEGEGTLKGYLDVAVQFFADLPERIRTAVNTLGVAFIQGFAAPIVSGLNQVISSLETFINAALVGIADLLTGIQGVADAIGLGTDLAGAIAGLRTGVVLPRVPPPLIPAAAKGGTFSSGLLRVGEHGEELIGASSKLNVFPNGFVRALDTFNQIMSQPMPMALPMGGAGNTTNNNNNSVNATFNGLSNPQDMVQRLATLRSL